MVPEGWLELTLKRWPWDDLKEDAPKPYKLRVEFRDMTWWRRDENGVLVRCPTEPLEFMFIPWHNIICLEWMNNSEEYAKWAAEQRKGKKVQVGNLTRGKIVEVLCSQALADHLGDVRDAERTLWSLIGVDRPETEHDTAWKNVEATLNKHSIPLPDYLQED